ncbi:hypothetical protein Syun_028483 [Stephania yunnanensis]|uniref:Uncharacterized protein n=1 Tax=Stephania yunnanensis TaxID=152371 RepID=A0AAP0EMP9_9MAGN
MPVDENIALKKNLKLKVKLPQPKSQVENITVKKKLKLKVKLPRAKWSEEEKSDLVYKDQDLMEISKRKLPPKLHGHLRRLGLLCENKDNGEIASEIHIFTSSCFKSNVIGKGERVDPLKVKQGERERFEKKQREEKARIDAHVKATKEEAALKLLRRDKVAGSHLRRWKSPSTYTTVLPS